MELPGLRYDFGPDDVQGLKFFQPIRALLERLHALHDHPNRLLHYDEYIALILLYFFNPIITSMRALQHASSFKRVQAALGTRRFSLGSFSEAAHIFDPAPLRDIFRELGAQALQAGAPHRLPRPKQLPEELRLAAADGTVLSYLPRMVPWFYEDGPRTGPPPGIKLHLQYDVLNAVPLEASCSDGFASEKRALESCLRGQTLYVLDRGYVDFTLLQAILNAKSSFLIRLGRTHVYDVIETHELTSEARRACVTLDALVAVGSAPHAEKLKQPLRLIRARVPLAPPHNLNPKRGKPRRNKDTADFLDLILLTDRFDLPAELLLTIFRQRWHVETFFRWLKCTMRCKHLLVEDQRGLELQIYAALIASLLILIWTRRKPNKRLLETLQFYLAGWATLDEVEAHFDRLKTTRA